MIRREREIMELNSDCAKYFFTNAVVRDWNRLPPSMVQCSSIDSFQNRLDRYVLHLSVHYVIYSVMVANWYY